MPWTQDGSGGLANANGVSAVIATRRTGRIANENLRQSVVSLYSMDSGYPYRRILSSNFGFCEGPNVARPLRRRRPPQCPGGSATPFQSSESMPRTRQDGTFLEFTWESGGNVGIGLYRAMAAGEPDPEGSTPVPPRSPVCSLRKPIARDSAMRVPSRQVRGRREMMRVLDDEAVAAGPTIYGRPPRHL